MPLEAVMFCVDNSEYMRNGDFEPTRLNAQSDTVSLMAQSKTGDNQETAVGVLSMAGPRISVLTTLTRDMRLIMNALHAVKVAGFCNFVGALKTAQLALKNRLNKSQRQRIIMFVGSPVEADKKSLVKLGKQLKKNNVSVDVVNFGEENMENENKEKLEEFINAVNSTDNSRLLNVPPSSKLLSNVVLTSPLLNDSSAAAPRAAPATDNAYGVDPNEDPELAMALRMSMEEARARESEQNPSANNEAGQQDMDMDDDDLLAQAIAMSMAHGADGDGDVDMPAEDANPSDEAKDNTPANDNDDFSSVMQDPAFIDSLLESAGVNKDDINVEEMFGSGNADDKSKDKDKSKNADKK